MVANSLVLYRECAECGSGIGESNIRSVQTFDRWITISAVITHSAAAGANLKKLRSVLALHLGKPMSFIENLDVHL